MTPDQRARFRYTSGQLPIILDRVVDAAMQDALDRLELCVRAQTHETGCQSQDPRLRQFRLDHAQLALGTLIYGLYGQPE